MNCPHCNDHIDTHPPSRCLAEWIATDVMGWEKKCISTLPAADVTGESFYWFDGQNMVANCVTWRPDLFIGATWEVAMHFKDRQYSVVLEGGDAFAWSRWDFSIWSPLDDPDFSDAMAHGWDESRDLNDRVASAPLAICRASIKATHHEVD